MNQSKNKTLHKKAKQRAILEFTPLFSIFRQLGNALKVLVAKKRHIMAGVLVCAITLAMIPIMSLSAAATGQTTVSTWDELQDALSTSGNIKLIQNITADEFDTYLYPARYETITIDLNGFNIDRNLDARNVFGDGCVIYNRANLTITDTSTTDASRQGKITGGISYDGSGIYNMGTLTLNAGNISENNVGSGVYNEGTFIMNGGNIAGNFSSYGGGVYNCGTYNMYGGNITENYSISGGGVYNESIFNMYGGSITENYCCDFGGGVFNIGTTKVSGDATVTGNLKAHIDIDKKPSGGVKSNVFLSQNKTITVAGALTGEIGISAESTSYPVTVACGGGTYSIENSDVARLTSDSASLKTILSKSNVVLTNAPIALSASDFIYTAPSSLIYDGNAKAADVSYKEITDGSDITVEYWQGNTRLGGAPTEIGDYIVKISAEAKENYLEVKSLQVGAFTITEDKTKPNVTITVGDHTWDSLQGSLSVEAYYKDAQTLTVTAEDADSGIDKIYYYFDHILQPCSTNMNASESSAAEYSNDYSYLNDVDWTEYNGAFTIEPNNSFVIFVKVTDKAGNEAIISSGGIVLDNIAPNITLTDNATYCGETTAYILDSNIKAVTVDGEAITWIDNVCSALLKAGTHTIVATDRAGNESIATVTINEDHTWDAGKLTKAPTAAQEGERLYTCSICSMTKTEPVAKLAPTMLEGLNGKHAKGSADGITFKTDALISDLLSVSVDGVIISADKYTTAENSAITLSAEFLNTLTAGKHTVDIKFISGTISTEFTIEAGVVTSPQTGDNSIMLCFALLLSSLCILTACGTLKKHKKQM